MIRILANENCDRLIVIALREAGYDVNYVAETDSGESDEELSRLARENGQILLTDDLDFGLLAKRALEHPPAIILMGLDPLSRAARCERVLETLNRPGDEVVVQFVVIEPDQVRFHRLSGE
jgi:predicted nuclease of predicted toxin-antitoxin system